MYLLSSATKFNTAIIEVDQANSSDHIASETAPVIYQAQICCPEICPNKGQIYKVLRIRI